MWKNFLQSSEILKTIFKKFDFRFKILHAGMQFVKNYNIITLFLKHSLQIWKNFLQSSEFWKQFFKIIDFRIKILHSDMQFVKNYGTFSGLTFPMINSKYAAEILEKTSTFVGIFKFSLIVCKRQFF